LVEQFVQIGFDVADLKAVEHKIEGVFRLDGDIDRMRIGGAAGGVIASFRDDHGLARRGFERVCVQDADPVAKRGIVAGAEIGVGVAIIGVGGLIARVAIVRQASEALLNDRYARQVLLHELVQRDLIGDALLKAWTVEIGFVAAFDQLDVAGRKLLQIPQFASKIGFGAWRQEEIVFDAGGGSDFREQGGAAGELHRITHLPDAEIGER
jgi:hypothetical protein